MFDVAKFIAFFLVILFLFYRTGKAVLYFEAKATHASVFITGVLVFYLLSLLTSSLMLGLVIQFVSVFVIDLKKRKHFRILGFSHNLGSMKRLLFVGAVASVFSLFLLLEPVHHWDARSIWYYHGRVIYHTQSPWASGDWLKHAHLFSHIEYPKFYPTLIALTANLGGVWNEFLPKMANVILMLPVLFFVYDEIALFDSSAPAKKVYSMLLFATVLFFSGSGFFLLSGYVDGWIALYALLASLSLAFYFERSQSISALLSFLSFSAFLATLKQEGFVISLVLYSVAFVLSIIKLNRHRIFQVILSCGKRGVAQNLTLFFIFFNLAPTILWKIGAALQNIPGAEYSGDAVGRLSSRLSNKTDAAWVFLNILFHNPLVSVFFALFIFQILGLSLIRIKVNVSDIIPAFLALGYGLILFFVYCSTGADLSWHLSCSAGRVGLTVGMLFAGSNLILIRRCCTVARYDPTEIII